MTAAPRPMSTDLAEHRRRARRMTAAELLAAAEAALDAIDRHAETDPDGDDWRTTFALGDVMRVYLRELDRRRLNGGVS